MGAALPEGAGVSAAAGGVLSPLGAGLGEGSVPTSGVSSTGRAGGGRGRRLAAFAAGAAGGNTAHHIQLVQAQVLQIGVEPFVDHLQDLTGDGSRCAPSPADLLGMVKNSTLSMSSPPIADFPK